VFVAAAAIVFSRIRGIRDSQLQVLLGLGGEYREAWRTRWRAIPPALAAVDGDIDRLQTHEFETLVDALNWIDWFGVACIAKIIHDPRFIFDTAGSSMMKLIESGSNKIKADEAQFGTNYWNGLRYVQKLLVDRRITDKSAAWSAAKGAIRD
jgi:hypothetical protein